MFDKIIKMNREMKFRGKRTDKNELIYGGVSYTKFKSTFFINTFDSSDCMIMLEVEPNSVGQFTGLKDKNGFEIYEGDIVKGGSRIMQVFWQIEVCQFWLIWKDKNASRYEPLTINSAECIEIIGNICENPELLTK
jgi:uncharacterized phage protein (TIGR01671 family)